MNKNVFTRLKYKQKVNSKKATFITHSKTFLSLINTYKLLKWSAFLHSINIMSQKTRQYLDSID